MRKVLIACEYSGTIRESFKLQGWDATSCDILNTDIQGKHIIGDLFNSKINFKSYDLIIAHPPCKYLSKAGLHFENKDKLRIEKRNEAVNFFIKICELPNKHICIENPIGYINKHVLKYSQLIQPFYFGESEMKTTALWLFNLPLLQYSHTNNLFELKTSVNKPTPNYTWINKNGKIKNEYFTYSKTAHSRAKTFKCIANAMSDQWTNYFNQL